MKGKPRTTKKPDPLVQAAEELPREKRARKRNKHFSDGRKMSLMNPKPRRPFECVLGGDHHRASDL